MSSTPKIPPDLLARAQEHLERARILTHVITQVRGKTPTPLPHLGRYHFLWQALQASPPKGKSILDLSGKPFETWWESWVTERIQRKDQDGAFLHGLTLMYWEWADECEREGDLMLAERHYTLAAYYWRHLLARLDYWERFSTAQKHPQDGAYGETLRQRLGQMVINHHFEAFKSNQRNGDSPKIVHCHLKCLSTWTENPKPGVLRSAISGFKGDQEGLHTLDAHGENLFKGWLQTWLEKAQTILDDPNVRLPKGLRKNYDAAIKSLDPVLKFAPSNARLFRQVLLFVVEQSNHWGEDLLVQENEVGAEQLVQRFASWVDLLASVCTPPAPDMPVLGDADMLSTAYLFRARMSTQVERGAEAAKEARRWNRHAPDLVFQVQVQALLREADRLTQEFIDHVGPRDIANMDTQINHIMGLLTQARDLTAEAWRSDTSNYVLKDNLDHLEREIRERPKFLRARAVRGLFGMG